ncbi:MAG TPA: outer membrane beta-barrel protein [Terriglobales bacterium]|nr:outer membrane beta-barrel protein [Terriglobales bacterium]
MIETLSHKTVAVSAFPPVLILSLVLGATSLCFAQTQEQPGTPTKVAAMRQPLPGGSGENSDDSRTAAPKLSTANPSITAPDPALMLTLEKELAEMRARMDQISAQLAELKSHAVPVQPPTPAVATAVTGPPTAAPAITIPASATSPKAAEAVAPVVLTPAIVQTADSSATPPAKKQKIAPFSDWDWTWLNGNPRNKDTAFDTKFFTPEIRADVTYSYDFNKPVDDSMGGSSELFRSNEIQLEQLGVGGDFHLDNVRARLMTQFGMYSTATVRNDPSYAKGQWDIADADRYLSEAYGGYHLDVLNGINIDAGIFMSYVGLFSYYNFDNWAYQPSYVSSNTPWFFEGLRVQIFPTPHLKIEPWFINGWQSYGSSNSRKGLGGQIKWTPKPWMNILSNNYGLGHDDLYIPNRGRIHTDNSVEIKYFDKPGQFLDKMAFTFTGDLGCEFGPSTATLAGVSCHGNRKDPLAQPSANFPQGGIDPKQSFIGYMLYDRTWFKKDTYGLTIGGGQINNPGRYLVLLPPINGETASSAAINAPYFTGNPGDQFKAWDMSLTYDYMPKQWLTFRWEYDYRHASVPYWSGHGGVTPPGPGGVPYTNNGFPQYYACMNGGNTGFGDNSALSMAANEALAQTACSAQGSSLWTPDLRKDESLVDIDIMVKF